MKILCAATKTQHSQINSLFVLLYNPPTPTPSPAPSPFYKQAN